ncbi:hypothetical protein PHYBLDRAFT_62669 [Phycomyces blakesleeanus NRRL 1555(-)]|uniref:Uncharacterized protein n=1 Tax=Phycomyces blakesleeanus (strain ATCC 8743b / DSM 1359 / FGSC 10004 / NBRC 33097 / NRRL 1555) TaxID=763407 RepID=A0A167PUQ5_PHYB8|nr:hypothetical protein PHYBLDRAFT_62669 [Phycomyces blakesleeanus NRRL 1555(-)]OAD78567.1 hypothetical protein PHYBLDRAFT_62669 [Phycomyces blakesleeanus NRRL 1555(-)]|eukprot:XP_018296607.1 hypothetical protein PHYBLDRAFT_62669 [Phycomyces blakesleeanus NRRL 1555(-)]
MQAFLATVRKKVRFRGKELFQGHTRLFICISLPLGQFTFTPAVQRASSLEYASTLVSSLIVHDTSTRNLFRKFRIMTRLLLLLLSLLLLGRRFLVGDDILIILGHKLWPCSWHGIIISGP